MGTENGITASHSPYLFVANLKGIHLKNPTPQQVALEKQVFVFDFNTDDAHNIDLCRIFAFKTFR